MYDSASLLVYIPVTRYPRYPPVVVNLNDGGSGQGGGSDQTKVDMPVDEARHDRPRKPRHSRPLDSGKARFDRPQLTGNLLQDRWSVAMTDPEIIDSKPRAHRPISVRTA